MRWLASCKSCSVTRHRLQRKPLVSDPDMHHGTCGTHVPWCMSGSLTRGGGENVPGIPGAYATRNFKYLASGPWNVIFKLAVSNTCSEIFTLFNEYVSIFVKLIKFHVHTSILTQDWWISSSRSLWHQCNVAAGIPYICIESFSFYNHDWNPCSIVSLGEWYTPEQNIFGTFYFYCVHKSHYHIYSVHDNVLWHVLCIWCYRVLL